MLGMTMAAEFCLMEMEASTMCVLLSELKSNPTADEEFIGASYVGVLKLYNL